KTEKIMKGFFNQILHIDMSKKSHTTEAIDDEIFEKYLGGKGLSTHLLLKHNPQGVDPLGADNHLILSTGPFTGTSIWGSCRYGVYTKSPQTGLYSESYSGGTAADYMARTGFDGIIMHGAAQKPVWVEITDNGIFFHDADDLWGLETYEAEDRVKAWVKENRKDARKCGVICIGPAGENMVSFAVIENDYWRSAGRTGVGAVMGSKKIKAVAFWGKRKKEIADPGFTKNFVKEFAQKAKDDKGVQAYNSMGTPMMVDIMDNVGSFPTRYWHKGKSEHKDKINAPAFHEHLDVIKNACLKCFIACGRLSTVKEGRHKGLKIEGPEYETIFAFGGLCEVDSIEEIAYLNDICDRLGLDTISAGNLAGLTIEASSLGKVDYSINYGQTDKIAELLKDMAHRKGIGDCLAKGIKSVAKEWGMEDHAIHVKGLEPAGYDPRVLKGMGLAYGTSPRGACHMRATFYKPELANMIDPDQIEGKAEMFVEWEDRLIFFDSLILCRFYRDLYQWEELATMVKGITGLDLDKEGMQSIARNISDDTRRFNLQEGLTMDGDKLPKRFYTEVLPETQKVITEEQMDQMLKDYYKARGWDEMGRPA
ncbi:MAG: aldehyde ferredoxin oxidoreductase family protein, partial [Desulfobacterales bacterium]|nr:aldehyde ferredoxin oxidoreductase family protein [Desulfobacterales bacterium]